MYGTPLARLRSRLSLLLGVGLALSTAASAPLQAQTVGVRAYRFIDLGTLRGGYTAATGINDAGQISGKGYFEPATTVSGRSNTRAFRITPVDQDGTRVWRIDDGSGFNSLMEVYGLPSATYAWSEARAINNQGAAAGQVLADGYTTPQNAYYGAPDLTGAAVTKDHSWAWSINDSGSLVGETWPTKGGEFATLWQRVSGSFTKVTLGNGQARGINNLNQVAGHDGNGGGNPWIWLPAPAYGLAAGKNYLGATGASNAINDLGQIAGSDNGPTLWCPRTDTSGFGVPGARINLLSPGWTSGWSAALTNPLPGQPLEIVGNGVSPVGTYCAYRWDSADRVMRDLNTLVVNPPHAGLSGAAAINRNGLIVGTYDALQANGSLLTRSFLLVPDVTLPDAASAPPSVAALTGEASASNQVALSWSDVAGENGYHVLRGYGSDWLQIGSLPPGVTSFVDTLAEQGTRYSYRVTAFNVKGDSAPAEVTVVTPGVPLAPTGCRASSIAGPGVRVYWTNRSNTQTAVQVQYATNPDFTGALTATAAGDATRLDITGLAKLTTYYVRVRGVNGAGAGAFSNASSATTPRR